jgi:hypothetical protein
MERSGSNMSWKIYKLTSPNGRSYVGCTELELSKRWINGWGYHHNKELYDDILMYGWLSFNKEVIATYDDETEARKREHAEIQNYPDGYNIYRGQKGYIPTGNPRTPPKAVVCVETGQRYSSIKEAARQTGLAKNKISYCCRGIRKSTGGYHWKFA